MDAVDRAYAEAMTTKGKPTAIVAHTVKGKGVAWVENKNGAHGKPVDDSDDAIRELGGDEHRDHPARARRSRPHRIRLSRAN